MSKCAILLLVLPLHVVQATQLQVPGYAGPRIRGATDTPIITVTNLDTSDTRLAISYEIRNTSEHEIWLCDDIGFDQPYDAEIYVSEDNQLVTLRKRLDVPARVVWSRRPRARYVRLCAGETWRESLSVSVPLDNYNAFEVEGFGQIPRTLFHVSRLAIEIGYYDCNLPDMILRLIEEAEKASDNSTGSRPAVVEAFGDVLSFNYSRERLRNREEEVVRAIVKCCG